MKLTKKMIETANLSDTHFAKLAGVAPISIKRYFAKRNQKSESVEKIELAAQVLKECNLVWPSILHIPTDKGHKTYLKNKKKSDSLDKKFDRALKKAVKAKN